MIRRLSRCQKTGRPVSPRLEVGAVPLCERDQARAVVGRPGIGGRGLLLGRPGEDLLDELLEHLVDE